MKKRINLERADIFADLLHSSEKLSCYINLISTIRNSFDEVHKLEAPNGTLQNSLARGAVTSAELIKRSAEANLRNMSHIEIWKATA